MYEPTVLSKNGKERCVFNESFDVHSRHFSHRQLCTASPVRSSRVTLTLAKRLIST